MKNVIIKIIGKQGLGDQSEKVELSTLGTLSVTKNELTLSYDESEMMGTPTKTLLTVTEDNTVIMERKGALASKLIIKKGVRVGCNYSTAYGTLVLDIYGEKIESSLDENGGRLFMSYRLDHNMQPVSYNTVEIEVKLQ